MCCVKFSYKITLKKNTQTIITHPLNFGNHPKVSNNCNESSPIFSSLHDQIIPLTIIIFFKRDTTSK